MGRADADVVDPSFGYFRDLVGAVLTVREPDGRELPGLRCAKVDDRGELGGYHSFRVDFEGPADQPIGQGTFVLRAEEQPPVYVFLSPVGADAAVMQYEAIFNQVVR